MLLLRFQQLLLISKASKTISIFEKLCFGRYIAAGWQDNDFRVKVAIRASSLCKGLPSSQPF